MVYFLAAMAASGMVIAAGWRSRYARRFAAMQDRQGMPADPLWGDPEIDIGASEARVDVAGAIRLAVKRLAPVMQDRLVKVDVAAPSGLLGRMRGAVLADILEELLTVAIHGAQAGRLLLTAAMHGDRIYIGITDDVPETDPAVRAARIRGVMERVALRGGFLDIDVHPAEGTTMTLRLAAVTDERPEAKDRASEGLPESATWNPFGGGVSQSSLSRR
jgi:hypothetical protein